MKALEVISAAATRSDKQRGNEDRVLTLGVERPLSGGVVLCDGVGSTEGAAAAAERFSTLAAERLEGGEVGVWGLPAALQHALVPDEEQGKTTLIVLVAETTGFVSYLLVGNGSVVEMAPTRLPSGGTRLLWSDIALPHIDWSEGRPAVDSIFPVPPAGLRVVRGAQFVEGEPRVYVLCSDGLGTLEDRAEGAAPDGSTWREVPVGFARLAEVLGGHWGDLMANDIEVAGALLSELVEGLLDDLAREPGFEDDASLGVVILRPSVAVPEASAEGERAA